MIFSVGHSNLSWAQFRSLLDAHDIETIIDIRSYPRSRFAHFNRGNLQDRLKQVEVAYISAGDRLGGLTAAKAGYGATAQTPDFCDALDSVIEVGRRCRVALFCSEGDPIRCHRFLLVSRALAARGETVGHILRDGTVELHADLEERMLRGLKLPTNPCGDISEVMREAYRNQARKLGVRP